jgi:hypothetical protein
MSPRDPEYATFRDLVDAVDRVDDKLDKHKDSMSKRLGRIEKGLLAVALVALVHPQLPAKSLSVFEGAVHLIPNLF